jgi:hypothetical protein
MPWIAGVRTSEQLEDLAPLHRHRFRHSQDQSVAARGGHKGERNTGIPRRRLDQHRSGPDQAGSFHIVDHGDADAVLDAPRRAQEFELRQNVGFDLVQRRQPPQRDDRSVADRLGDRCKDTAAAGTVGRLGARGARLFGNRHGAFSTGESSTSANAE